MSLISPEVHESARSMVLGLTLNHLKSVARNARLPVSGPKASLQDRIINKLSDHVKKDDAPAFFRLRYFVEHPEASSAPPNMSFGATQSPSTSFYGFGSGSSRADSAYTNSHTSMHPGKAPMRLLWKPSPFHHVLHPITQPQECKVRETTRDSFECNIRLEASVIDKFNAPQPGQDLRLMVYCASEPVSTYSQLDVSFPQSIEIKVNSNEVKANLRGLKNKPGSTRPADITNMIHKKPNYTNVVTVTYALTQKRFFLVVNLVNKISPERLVDDLKARSRISKERVIRDMLARAQDSDIQTTSTVMSLKCPLSTLRMATPCRSIACAHNQCYDALSFLQLQEQAPTWTCPICSKPATFETIHIDGYVMDILDSSSTEVEQVTIEPNGDWQPVSTDHSQGQGQRSASEDGEEDDDLIEIQEPPRGGLVRANPTLTSAGMIRTPPHSSREQSTTSASIRSSGSKRPASAVIDLTLSSDDEEPPRPAKRQSIYPLPPQAAQPYHPGDHNASSNPRSSGISFNMQRPSGYPGPNYQNPLAR